MSLKETARTGLRDELPQQMGFLSRRRLDALRMSSEAECFAFGCSSIEVWDPAPEPCQACWSRSSRNCFESLSDSVCRPCLKSF
jgi:hypothetical protein